MLIDELLQAESWGIVHEKWIPAIKEAIALGEVDKLIELRGRFPYFFENSLKQLKKAEREFIRNRLW
ncbi:hypothetical protein C173_32236 [Paenibacillus sp. FSL R7-277]|uniref:hypothetical protein n=1 Tax=Paenibacillus sp. FSL R7-277 TaxID=1227352 RepID=UPI0003E280C6|nr:hypothetical protein [Paenibacillus sp. FSL R7-277]ETT57074.1 hypothetical protein C173_32236 [Paenibacillus sp. FSL R7-277]